jgi:hypothetical protein
MADPVTAMIVVAGVATAAEGVSQYQSEQSKLAGIKLRNKERELEYEQKTLANYDMTKKILDTQMAQAAGRGVALSSPSIEAIQRDTLNTSAKRQKNLDIEETLIERNARIEKENVQNTLYTELFGDVAQAATSFIGAKSKLPSKA